VDIAHAQDEPRQVGLDSDDYLIGLSRLVDMCERYGAQCSLEVNHAGLDALYDFNGVAAIGPTARLMEKEVLRARLKGREPVPAIEMTPEMIRDVVNMYVEGAYRCKRAGMNMCLVHGGHANLIGQFSSPLYNHRKDEYGGSLENRARFCIEILDGIRRRCGEDFVIEFRVSADEMHPDGMHFDETKEYLKMIEDKIDIVNVSCGLHSEYKYFRYWSPNMYMGEMINVPYARELKKILKCKVNTVAGICDLDNAERILSEGWADFVAMARPLMADPELVRKYAFNMPEERRPCSRCGYCGRRITGIKTVACGVNPMLGREDEFPGGRLPKAERAKKAVVIGSGPAGMAAAIALTQRGHNVTLFERESRLGGNLNAAAAMDLKMHMKQYLRYITNQTMKQVKDIRLNTPATPEAVMALEPEAIVIAVGADPFIPPVPGAGLPHVHWAGDAEMGLCEVEGPDVAVIGGGAVGLECAYTQAMRGRRVTIVELTGELTAAEAISELLPAIQAQGGVVLTSHKLEEIRAGSITVTDLETGEKKELAATRCSSPPA
jgi:2,4-dienoyl-CoA reductase-like NADH-dependent reductase (Old Yellow Enzyme family)/thioredoxin reductase